MSINSLVFLKTCFTDPINKKMLKETLTLFLSHQQQINESKEKLNYNKLQLTGIEREKYAAEIVQVNSIYSFNSRV